MTIRKLTPETYKQYFEQLAMRNKKIAHDPETHHQFFCVDMDEVDEDSFNYGGCDINNWTMVLEDMTGRFAGDDSEHLQVVTFGAFLILHFCLWIQKCSHALFAKVIPAVPTTITGYSQLYSASSQNVSTLFNCRVT